MLNKQIGPYKIISKLGEGGMANVYLAEKGTLGKKVALKVLKDEFLLNQHIRNRFLSEAKKMSGLNHANIVGVHDLIDETDFVAIELDYVEGKTLKQHLHEEGALADDEIEVLFSQMLDALAYIHERGFVHRDVKPSNFMLTENGIIKLTDFGIAKNVDDSNMDYTGTGTGMQMGTPKYMSPEQVRSTKDVDHRTDIYSLGVVLWEMVTGKVPYDIQTSSTFDVFTKIVNEPLDKTNTRWDEVIQKATRKEPKERYSYIREIILKEKIKVQQEEIEKPPITTPIQPSVKLNKYIIIITSILAVFLVVYFSYQKDLVRKQKIKISNNNQNNIENMIYQCPMDCEDGKTYIEKGQCPVCEIDLRETEVDQSIMEVNDKKVSTFQDPRDSKTYKWVKIGNQTWMAENLAYKPKSGNYWAYDNEFSNVAKYGYLYDWETACKVCPEGWHLPSDKDWKELEVTMGMSPSDAESIEWRGTNEGNVLRENDGFSAIFSGARNIRGSFHSLRTHGYWWSSTENSNKAWRRFIDTYESKIYRSTLDNRTGLSVRCLKSKNDDKEYLTKEVEKVKGFSSSVIKSNEKWKGIKDSLYIHKSLGTFYRLPVNYVSYGLHESNKAKIDMVLYDSIYGRPLGNLRRNESVEISNYEYHFYDFDKAVVYSCNNTVFDG